jgi:hypothetical protein
MKTSLLVRNLKSVFPERPSHRTLCALVAGLLLGAVSCSHPLSSGTSKKAPPPPFEIEDPIISMMMASSIDAKGELVNPAIQFPANHAANYSNRASGKRQGLSTHPHVVQNFR